MPGGFVLGSLPDCAAVPTTLLFDALNSVFPAGIEVVLLYEFLNCLFGFHVAFFTWILECSMRLRGFEGEGEGCEHPPSMRDVILPDSPAYYVI